MNKITSFVLAVTSLLTFNVYAASVGPLVIEDNAFVNTVLGTGGTVNGRPTPTTVNTAITDLDPSTYIFSSDGGYIDLSFGSTSIYNGDGTDLAFFFLSQESTFNLSLLGNSTLPISYTSQFLYVDTQNDGFLDDDGAGRYGVSIGTNYYFLTAALINLDDFGISGTDPLGGFRVGLGVNNALALVGGFHLEPAATVVPLPAPFLLFLSGLTALGVISRRKK